MGKIRVYQFAKLLKISNDEAVAMLRRHGLDIKSNLSSIDDQLVSEFQSGKLSSPQENQVPAGASPTSAADPQAQAAAKPRRTKASPKTSRKAGPVKKVRSKPAEI